MGDTVEKSTSIEAVEGGYIVHLNGNCQVTTSLQKAVGLVRDFLKGEQAAE